MPATKLEVFPVDKLYRVGVVVKDLKAAASNYAEIFGIDQWKVSHFDSKRLSNATVNGRSVEHSFSSATGTTPSGELSFELIEAGEGMSSYKVFRMTRGMGVHDLVLHVAKPNEMDALQAFFAEKGVSCSQSGLIDGSIGYYEFDTRALLGGYVLRVICSESGADIPADEEWDLSDTYSRPAGIAPIQVPNVGHFGVVVHDLMASVRNYAEFFGIPEWGFMNWRTEPGRLVEPYYIGAAGAYRPVNHEYFTTNIAVKNFGYEIIQPTFGPSHYKEDFLNIVGEGIHHMSLLMYNSQAEWDAQCAWLDSIGVPVCMGGDLLSGEIHFVYVNGQERLGFVVESVIIREQPDFGKFKRDFTLEFDDVPVGAIA